ncbi:MAG: methylamine utilization protein, partial [Alphaproteobacteria bacterium]|nr:methylamine utilization protein [Alphaproteobacteria bacterium]
MVVTVRDSNGAPVVDAVVRVTRKDGAEIKTMPLSEISRINQLDTEYQPYVSVITVGSKVEFTNSDAWAHHVYSFSKIKRFDVTVPANTN